MCGQGGMPAPPEAGDQASQAEISQICRTGELEYGEDKHRPLKEDSDAEHRCKRPDDASHGDAKRGERGRSPSGQERIACDQGCIWPRRHNQQRCYGQIGCKPYVEETHLRCLSVLVRNSVEIYRWVT